MGEIKEGWNNFKAWYKSKTIIGVIIAAIGTLVQMFWPEVDVQAGAEEILNSGEEIAFAVDDIWGSILQVIGLAVAAWGRFSAKVGIK